MDICQILQIIYQYSTCIWQWLSVITCRHVLYKVRFCLTLSEKTLQQVEEKISWNDSNINPFKYKMLYTWKNYMTYQFVHIFSLDLTSTFKCWFSCEISTLVLSLYFVHIFSRDLTSIFKCWFSCEISALVLSLYFVFSELWLLY